MNGKKALLLVDLQNDFCQGGNLAVPDADAIIPLANQLQAQFEVVVASKDWHPADHMSFAVNHPGHQVGDCVVVHGLNQVLWPVHCVQETRGADFHPELNTQGIHHIVLKGCDKAIDSYSAFYDNEHRRITGLADYLRRMGVETLYIMGLATDYCVNYSCHDAVQLGFRVHIIEDGCRGVELVPGDTARAFDAMRAVGVKITQAKDIIS